MVLSTFPVICIHIFPTILGCPSSSYYETINGQCYFFEKSKKTYQQAQINCQLKFGSYQSGRLVEPMSVKIGKALFTKAKALNLIKSHYDRVWIGYDAIGRGTGNFKYA